MVVVMMVMTVNAVSKSSAKTPHRVRHTEPDQKQSSHRHHLLAERLEELRTEDQSEKTEHDGDGHVSESAHKCNACRPSV